MGNQIDKVLPGLYVGGILGECRGEISRIRFSWLLGVVHGSRYGQETETAGEQDNSRALHPRPRRARVRGVYNRHVLVGVACSQSPLIIRICSHTSVFKCLTRVHLICELKHCRNNCFWNNCIIIHRDAPLTLCLQNLIYTMAQCHSLVKSSESLYLPAGIELHLLFVGLCTLQSVLTLFTRVD